MSKKKSKIKRTNTSTSILTSTNTSNNSEGEGDTDIGNSIFEPYDEEDLWEMDLDLNLEEQERVPLVALNSTSASTAASASASSKSASAKSAANTNTTAYTSTNLPTSFQVVCFFFAYFLQATIYGCKLAGHFSETTLAREAQTIHNETQVLKSMGSIIMWFSLLDICAWMISIAALYVPEHVLSCVRKIWFRHHQRQQRQRCIERKQKNSSNSAITLAATTITSSSLRQQLSHWFLQGYISCILMTAWLLLEHYVVPKQSPLATHHLLIIPWIAHSLWILLFCKRCCCCCFCFCCRNHTTQQHQQQQQTMTTEASWLIWLKVIIISLLYTFLGSEMAYQHFLKHDLHKGPFEDVIDQWEMELDLDLDLDGDVHGHD